MVRVRGQRGSLLGRRVLLLPRIWVGKGSGFGVLGPDSGARSRTGYTAWCGFADHALVHVLRCKQASGSDFRFGLGFGRFECSVFSGSGASGPIASVMARAHNGHVRSSGTCVRA